jgi:hypothetical protein
MHRRRALALAVTLLCGCSNPPDATGPRTPPTPGDPTAAAGSLRVAELAVEEGDDGSLRAVATIRNETDARRTRTLRIRVRAGDTRAERRRSVTVPGTAERDVVFEFPGVAYDDFSGGGSLNSNWV